MWVSNPRYLFLLVSVAALIFLGSCDQQNTSLTEPLPDQEEELAYAHRLLDTAFYYTYDRLSDIKRMYAAADSIFRSRNDRAGMTRVYACRANLNVDLNQYQQALEYFDSTLLVADTTTDGEALITAHTAAGLAHANWGNYETALEHYGQVYRYSQSIPDTGGMILALGNTAYIYLTIDDKASCKDNLLQSIALSRAIKDTLNEGNLYLNLSTLYDDTLAYGIDSFRYYNLQALALFESIGNGDLTRSAQLNLADADLEEGCYEKVLLTTDKILAAITPEVELENTIISYYRRAKAYYKLNYLAKAREDIDAGLQLSYDYQDTYYINRGQELLVDYYRYAGNYREADRINQELVAAKEKLNREKLQEELQQLRTEVALKRKEQEITQLKVDQLLREQQFSATRNIRTAIFVALICGAFGFVLWNLQRTKSAIAQRQRLIAEAKLEFLRSQMNPHFIFNSFNGIQNFILKSEKIEAYNYLGKFASLLRMVMENSGDNFVDLKREIDILERYLELEQLRFRNSFTYQIEVAPNLDVEDIRIPAMMIQPYVENAIVHGISPLESGGRIDLSFQLLGNNIEVKVRDNGVGRTQSIRNKDPKNHLSLSSINGEQRINFLQEIGYENAAVRIEDLHEDGAPKGTVVHLSLPKR
ncbi:MAG: histidine kinase [Bacteroidota bacterium]